MTESIIFSVIVLVACGVSFFLGHLFTMRGIAHVQPSASSVPEMGSVYTEPDPFELDYGDEEPSDEEVSAKGSMLDTMEGMGLNVEGLRATMSGEPMKPVGVSSTWKDVPSNDTVDEEVENADA
jgi:hypothetical protein